MAKVKCVARRSTMILGNRYSFDNDEQTCEIFDESVLEEILKSSEYSLVEIKVVKPIVIEDNLSTLSDFAIEDEKLPIDKSPKKVDNKIR